MDLEAQNTSNTAQNDSSNQKNQEKKTTMKKISLKSFFTKIQNSLKKFFNQKKEKPTEKNTFTELFHKNKGSIIEDIVKQQDQYKADQEKKKQSKNNTQKKLTNVLTEREKKLAKEQDERKKIQRNILLQRYISVAIFVILFIIYGFYIVQLDKENTLLQVFQIENIGIQEAKSQMEKDLIENKVNNIKREISKIERNTEIINIKNALSKIHEKRINWTRLIKEVQIATADVPQSFRNDLVFNSYSGKAKDKSIQISGNAANEKVFTLIANLVDTLEQHELFSNVVYRKYSKSLDEDNETIFESNVQVKFNFE